MILFAFDTETPHVDLDVVPAPPMVCLSLADDSGCHLLARPEGVAWLRARLLDPAAHIVGCNLAFDLGVALVADPALLPLIIEAAEAGRLHDVAIREALIDIGKGTLIDHGDEEESEGFRYGLALLVERHLGIDISADKEGGDAWRLRYGELVDAPISEWPWAARVYPLRDAQFTLDVFRKQEGLHPNLADEPRQVRAALALHLIRLWGLRTDAARVAKLDAEVDAEWRAALAEFTAAGIFRPDGSKDTKALGARVVAAYGDRAPRTPTGKVATDRDTLVESGDPVLEKLGKSGKNDKRRTTYLPILKRGIDRPWHPSFNVLVGTTRVSSDAQQFPKDGGIRECFRPRPGYCYCSVDYGGLELRTMSQRAIWQLGYSLMAEALNAGKDVHTIVAAQFMGRTYEQVLPAIKAKAPQETKFRDLGKIFNFGKGGGMGAGAMAYNARAKDNVRFCLTTGAADRCGIQKKEVWVQGKRKAVCVRCIDVSRQLGYGWLRAWPEQQELANLAGAATEHGAVDVVIPGGDTPIIRGDCGYTQWLNTPFQGLGAKVVKDAMWRVSREMHTDRRSPMWGSHLVLNVHDELVAEMPIDCAPEAAERMAHIMRETAREWMPDLAPSVEADPAISLTLSKKMATVRDASGRLQLWSPDAAKKARLKPHTGFAPI